MTLSNLIFETKFDTKKKKKNTQSNKKQGDNMHELKQFLAKNGIKLSDDKVKSLYDFYLLVSSENQKYNLTSITEKQDFYTKHILDSLIAKDFFAGKGKVVDLGSGGGFPAIPIKIYNPDLDVTMIDSVGKKVNFLNFACAQLGLENIHAKHVRIEDFAKDNREKFDICSARAVANLSTLLEYALPLLKVGGVCVFYKAQKIEEEISASQNALDILGAKIENVFKFDLCGNQRFVVIVKKVSPTPIKYPRPQNKPRLMPL